MTLALGRKIRSGKTQFWDEASPFFMVQHDVLLLEHLTRAVNLPLHYSLAIIHRQTLLLVPTSLRKKTALEQRLYVLNCHLPYTVRL